jgi:hypothetical protein
MLEYGKLVQFSGMAMEFSIIQHELCGGIVLQCAMRSFMNIGRSDFSGCLFILKWLIFGQPMTGQHNGEWTMNNGQWTMDN